MTIYANRLPSGWEPGGVTYLWYLKYMNVITLTEKRFFEWHEDEVSVTIRNKSGSYGGSEVLVIEYTGDDCRPSDPEN